MKTPSRFPLPRKQGLLRGLLLLLLVLAGWWWILGLPFTGVDAWPILVQAERIGHRPAGLWSERYLEGLWEGVTFWRPGWTALTTLLSTLFGERPVVFHLFRLLALLGCAALAGNLASRREPGDGKAAWWIAAALVSLHPIQAETVPAMARGADSLGALCILGTLAGLAGLRERGWSPAAALGLLAAFLAPGFKETGLIAPVLGIVALEPWRRGPRRPAAGGACAVLAAGLLFHTLRRWWWLGTLGRYEDTLPPLTPLEASRQLASGLLDHQGWGVGWPALAFLVAGLLLGRRSGMSGAVSLPPEWRRVRTACWAWTGVSAAVFVTSPLFRERYAEGILAPLAVLAAGAIAQRPQRAGRLALLSRILAVLGLLGILLPGTPLLFRYGQWEASGKTATTVLDRLDRALQQARSQGRPVEVQAGRYRVAAAPVGPGRFQALLDPFPMQPAQPAGWREGRLANVAVLSPYAVHSYLVWRGWPAGSVDFRPGLPLLGASTADLPAEP